LSRLGRGQCLIRLGRGSEGLQSLDEVMVAMNVGTVSPLVAGLAFCAAIESCQQILEVRRAQEWTAALTRWCASQPDLIPYRGDCLVHRAEILTFHGAWPEAYDEAERARTWLADTAGPSFGNAYYRLGELHRLRGEYTDAEAAYKQASLHGHETQPGLGLLRLAQGHSDSATAAIRRALDETTERSLRARLLPAFVEIMLAAGDLEAARAAAAELGRIADGHEAGMLGAMAALAQGAVELAAGDVRAALGSSRHAARVWQQLEAPFEVAQARTLVGLACRALGDRDTAAFELEAARGIFAGLDAAPELARVETLMRPATPSAHGLTAREQEVLGLVAAGKSNREIAAELVLSEHTVARHLQNIFAKLGVSSRTAASAFAWSETTTRPPA
jgi:DNA-binding CsgD family transcriptional regulator